MINKKVNIDKNNFKYHKIKIKYTKKKKRKQTINLPKFEVVNAFHNKTVEPF